MIRCSTRWREPIQRRTAVLLALLFLGGFSEARLSAFVPPASHAVSETASDSASQQFFFGVMGQIDRPGVYEIPTARPKLTKVIDRAGGLTAAASRSVRVVRNGRIAFQTYYTPRLTLTLRPGDLLLVDGRRTDYRHGSNEVSAGNQIGPRTSPTNAAPNSRIEVAFVGLIDRPVVLRLRPRDAAIGRVVQLLKQPARVIKTMRLISPARSQRTKRPVTLTPTTPIPTGSVVIFRRAHLETTRIPPLPKPIRPQTSSFAPERSQLPLGLRAPRTQNNRDASGHGPAAGQAGIIQTSGERSAKPADPLASNRKKGRIAALLKSARADLQQGHYDAARRKALAAQHAGIPFALDEDRPGLILAEVAKRMAASAVRKAPEPPQTASASHRRPKRSTAISEHRPLHDVSPIHSAVTLSGRNVPHRLSQLAPPKSVDLTNEEPFSSRPVVKPDTADAALATANGSAAWRPSTGESPMTDRSSAVTAAAEPNRSAVGLVWLFVAGCGVLAIGFAAAFLISMARVAMKTTTAERTHTANDDALEALIHNTIEIREETIGFPTALTLHGRPTGLQKLRIDAGRAQLRGPHFAVAEVTTDNATTTAEATPSAVGLRVDPPQGAAGTETAGRRREPLEPPQRGAIQRDLLDRVLSTVNKVTDA